jgi:hypothetical protein
LELKALEALELFQWSEDKIHASECHGVLRGQKRDPSYLFQGGAGAA